MRVDLKLEYCLLYSYYLFMSLTRLAYIAAITPKWIQNARRLLGRPASSHAAEARWFGLTHALHAGLSCTLREAARIADIALAAPLDQRWLCVRMDDAERAEIVVDLWRDHSIFLARLSHATMNPVQERRGRPSAPRPRRTAMARALAYGVDVARLRGGLARSPAERLARLDDNAAFLAVGRAALARQRVAT